MRDPLNRIWAWIKTLYQAVPLVNIRETSNVCVVTVFFYVFFPIFDIFSYDPYGGSKESAMILAFPALSLTAPKLFQHKTPAILTELQDAKEVIVEMTRASSEFMPAKEDA